MIPGGLGLDQGIEDDEELAEASDEGSHFGFSLGEEVVVEGVKFGVVADGNEGRHEEGLAERFSAAARGAFAAHESTIAIAWCHTDQGRDLSSTDGSQFWEFGDEDSGSGGTDTWDGLEDFGGSLELGILLDDPSDFCVEGFSLAFEGAQAFFDQLADELVGSACQAVLLLDEERADLIAASGQSAKFLGVFGAG